MMMIFQISIILITVTNLLVANDKEFTGDYRAFESSFKKLVLRGDYIDRSMLVQAFLAKPDPWIVFVMAPQNFGKTVNIEMLKRFFEVKVNSNGTEIKDKRKTSNYKLFDSLQIFHNNPKFFKKYFGQFPVIHVDYGGLAYVKNYEEMLTELRMIVWRTVSEYKYLLDVKDLWKGDVELKKEMFTQYVDLATCQNLTRKNLIRAVNLLGVLIWKQFGKEVMLLIDEFDACIYSVIFNQVDDTHKMIDLFDDFNNYMFRESMIFIEKIFITGTLNIEGKGMVLHEMKHFYKLLKDYHFLGPHRYTPFFSIPESDLSNIVYSYTVNRATFDKYKVEIFRMYDGYYEQKEDAKLFNIFSIFKYLKNSKSGQVDALRPYWSQPSFSKLFSCVFRIEEVRNRFKKLLQNEGVPFKLVSYSRENIITLQNIMQQQKMNESDINLVFSFLYQQGFLTFRDNSSLAYIPNVEIAQFIDSKVNSDVQ